MQIEKKRTGWTNHYLEKEIHCIPDDSDFVHRPSLQCGCHPTWDTQNMREFNAGKADKRVYVHKEFTLN